MGARKTAPYIAFRGETTAGIFMTKPFTATGTLFRALAAARRLWARPQESPQPAESPRNGAMTQVHLDTIEALAMAIDAKGQMTGGHLRRVQSYAVGLARLAGADKDLVDAIRLAALLHDVGKLAVPDYILNKPGPLTEMERQKLRTYPRIGAEILAPVEFPWPVVPIVRHHQERWDGSGYPDGLKGPAIPPGARILAIADAADAMLSERPYRAAIPREDMVEFIRGEAGTHFEPALIEVFCAHWAELEAAVAGVEPSGGSSMDEIAAVHRAHAARVWDERSPAPAGSGERQGVLSNISATRREELGLAGLQRDLNATSSLRVDETLDIIMARLRSLVSFDTGAIYLVERKTGLIVPALASGPNADVLRRKSFRRGEGVTGWVVDNGNQMVNVPPQMDFYGGDVETGRQYRSAIVMPLIGDDGCLGTVTLYDREENHFGPEDERILERIVPTAAQAIQKAQFHQETRDHAMTDTLTGLPNSRWLYQQLEQEMSRARRGGRPLAVVVMDLDRLQPINETHGHHVGDEVLRQVAGCLRTQFRSMDSVCRWADDEFVVLLPEADPRLVAASIQRVQQAVEATFVPSSAGRSVPVGVSAGWAVFPHDGETFEELMRVANKRMDRNKSERLERGQTASA